MKLYGHTYGTTRSVNGTGVPGVQSPVSKLQ